MAYSSRGTSRGKKRGSGSEWKSSPILAVVAVIAIIFAFYHLFSSFSTNTGRFIITAFPYQWIAVNSVDDLKKGVDEGYAVTVKRYDTDKRPPNVPFQEGGSWWWDVLQCNSPKCPYLATQKDVPEDQRKGFIFPNVSDKNFEEKLSWANNGYPAFEMSEEMSEAEIAERNKYEELMHTQPNCPHCSKLRNPEFSASEYNDAEGQQKLAELREKILRETRR